MRCLLFAILLTASGVVSADDDAVTRAVRKPIPDKLVVLTFDDSARSHYTFVRPLLKQYEFGATFFITEGFDFKENKRDYMTWEQIRQLHDDGFEIGNHTRDHLGITDKTVGQLAEQLEGYRVIALRDLQEFVDADVAPTDHRTVINARCKSLTDQTDPR